MSSLETWVSDQLLSLLGQSDSTTVHYFLTLAASSPSPSALLATLTSNGLPSTPAATRFANELFTRAPRKNSSAANSLGALKKQEEARRKAEKEKKQLQGQRFSLMLDEPDESTATSSSSSSAREKREKREKRDKEKDREASSSKKGKEKERSRRREGDAWGSEDEEEREIKRRREDERYAREDALAARRGGASGADGEASAALSAEETEEEKAARIEQERLADLEERDAFAARMKNKDKDRTKKLVEDRSSKHDPDSLLRQALSADPKAASNQMGSLRERSRQSYLGKREQQQLDLLRIEIADWERDFRGVKLTKKEEREIERKKELLRLAEERLAIDDGTDGYMMPDGALLSLPSLVPSCVIVGSSRKLMISALQTTSPPKARSTRNAKPTSSPPVTRTRSPNPAWAGKTKTTNS